MAASASRASWSPNDPGPSRSRSAPRTDAGGRWVRERSPAAWASRLAARRPRSSTSARVRDAVWRSSHASVVADVRPATRSSARRSVATSWTATSRARTGPRSIVAGACVRTDQDHVERPVDVHAQPPSATQILDGVAGHLGQPARKRVVARQVRDARQVVDPGDGDRIGGVAVVGQGPRLARTRPRSRMLAGPEASRGVWTPSPGRPARESRPPGLR